MASLSGGVASLTTSSLSAGAHNIEALYTTSTGDFVDINGFLTETINSSGSTTGLSSSANPSILGSPVTLTATVTASGRSPAGSVTFYSNGGSVGSAALVSGTATLTVTPTAGTTAYTASYTSTNSLSPSTSGAFSQIVLVPVTVQASPVAGQFTVDGVTLSGSQTFNWVAGSSHSLGTPSPQAIAPGTQLVWSSWSNAGAISQTITAPSVATTYTAALGTQYLVTANASPTVGGTVSGSGYYPAGTTATLTATANSGFTFTSFSGASASTSNPVTLTVNGPLIEAANFTAQTPSLAVSTGARTDGTVAGTRNVVINLGNNGAGTAYNAQITSVTIATIAGSGAVTLVSGVPGPLPAATLAIGASTAVPLVFNWPTTATRVQFTFRLSSTDGGGTSYTTTQTATSYR